MTSGLQVHKHFFLFTYLRLKLTMHLGSSLAYKRDKNANDLCMQNVFNMLNVVLFMPYYIMSNNNLIFEI